jgi:hypothetical protein
MFSLGVVLYELLSGRRPFRGDSPMETMQQVLSAAPLPLAAVCPDLPLGLNSIVMRMLQKQPQERYDNWAELALDLARVGQLSIYDQTVADSEKFTALRKSHLLTGLTGAELWELSRIGIWQRLPSNSILVREGDPGDSLFLLGAGEAKVTYQGRLLDVLRAGDAFGEMAYIRGESGRRQATVQTATEALVAELPRDALERMSMGCQLHLTRALLGSMADRLAMSNARLARATAS